MNKAETKANLAKVKTELADKCDRLIKATGSIPRKRTLTNQAARFRRQAADLKRE
jgi:hypothetical protein